MKTKIKENNKDAVAFSQSSSAQVPRLLGKPCGGVVSKIKDFDSTPKPKIPPKAEREIMRLLGKNMSISTEKIAEILEKHGVSGNAEALQKSYRKRVDQRLMASLRDEKGNREVLCGAKEYVVVNGCADARKLKGIRSKLHKCMSGLDNSAKKVKGRLSFLSRFGGSKWKS